MSLALKQGEASGVTAQAHRVLLALALLLELSGDICAPLLRLRQLRLQPLLVIAELQERPARKVSGRVHHEESEWDRAPQGRECDSAPQGHTVTLCSRDKT